MRGQRQKDIPTRNRRKEKRAREEILALIGLPDSQGHAGNNMIKVSTQNLSISGAKLVVNRHIPEDTILKITLMLSRTGQVVNLLGKVRWTKKLKSRNHHEIGVQFLHENGKTVLALIAHLYGKKNQLPVELFT